MSVIEIVDVVTANNEFLGKKPRNEIHKTGEWHRGIHIFLFDREGNLLIQKRSNKKAEFPGKYDCSVSEHLIAGEDFQNGVKRGLKEELGIEGVKLIKVMRFRMNYTENDNMISELYFGELDGRIKHERFFIVNHEVQKVIFISMKELKEMVEEESDDFTPWLKELLKWYFSLPSKVEEIKG